MALADILDMARLQLRDTTYAYRWSNETLIRYVNDGVKHIRGKRPDVRISASGGDIPYSELPLDGAFTFTPTVATYVDSYDQIQGWRYNTWPTLYFYATSSSSVGIYATSSDVANKVDPLATFSGAVAGNIALTPGIHRGEPSGFGNTIHIKAVISATTAWNVTVTNPTMILDDHLYDEALSNYVCAECLASEGEDTFNAQRVKYFADEYVKQIMGG